MSLGTVQAGEPDLRELFATFGKIGLLSFGGPAGQIALMHRIIVDEKRWLDEARFLHALNYCMLLPGPEATQLATYAGWLLRGVSGGLIAGILFVLPGALVLIFLSGLYVLLGDVPVVEGFLFGLKAAVLAVVIEALVRLSKRALQNSFMAILAVAAFVAIAFLAVPFPVIILAAAVIGVLDYSVRGRLADGNVEDALEIPAGGREWTKPSVRRFVTTTITWLVIWLLPMGLLYAGAGGGNVFTQEAAFFSRMAMVTFGGAYAVLAYVAQQAVEVYGWLKPDEMLTGLGLAETTPGPLILVLVFVGFLGGARLGGFEPLTGGTFGALVALWFTFVPCFLWIFAGAPYVETVRNVRWLASALAAVTAAVVGVIANLALWFGMHVLFASVGEGTLGPFAYPVPAWPSFDAEAAAIALCAGVALVGFHANLFLVLGAAAMAGAVLRLL